MLRRGVLTLMRSRNITCGALQCKFQHVQYFAPDFGTPELIPQYSNGFQHGDKLLMVVHVILGLEFSDEYF